MADVIQYPNDNLDLFEEPEKDNAGGFVVDNQESAEWCLKRILDAKRIITEHEKHADDKRNILLAEMAKIETYLQASTAEYRATIERMEIFLEPWVKSEITRLPTKKKSLHIIGGVVGFRKSSPRLNITNEEEALAYCKEYHPELIKTTEVVMKGEAKKFITTKGEIIPGTEMQFGDVKFYWEEEK